MPSLIDAESRTELRDYDLNYVYNNVTIRVQILG